MSYLKDQFYLESACLQRQQSHNNIATNHRPPRHSFSNTRSTKTTTSKSSLAKRQSLPTSIQERVAHGERYKTEMCKQYQLYKSCRYDSKCQYAHGEAELRTISRHPKYKTEECRTYHSTGFCPYGSRCHFVHDKSTKASEEKPQDTNIYNINNEVDMKHLYQLHMLYQQQKEQERIQQLQILQLLIQQQKMMEQPTAQIWPPILPMPSTGSSGTRSPLESESDRGSPFYHMDDVLKHQLPLSFLEPSV